MMRHFFPVLLLALSPLSLVSQNTIPNAPTPQEEHYEFLKEELTAYRAFIQQEREQHQQFLTWTMAIVGGVTTFFIGFLSLKTWSDVKKTKKEYLEEAQRKVDLEVQAARLEFDKEVQSIFQSDPYLKDAKLAYEKYTQMVSQKLAVEAGKYLLLVDESKRQGMEEQELQFFQKAINAPTITSSLGNIRLKEFDVMIYRSNVDEHGEDAFLKTTLLPQLTELKVQNILLPLVIYARGRDEFLKNNTEAAINAYGLATIANYTTTLIDNTASAFRVAKLMEGENA
jgi:hypothetical protein